jgi:hypothetical protein
MAATQRAQERHLAYIAKAEAARRVAHLHRYDVEARNLWEQIADEWQHLAQQVLRMDKM